MTSFPETFVLNSRDIRSGGGETYGEMLLFVFGPPRARLLPSCVPYPGLVIPPGIPFNVSSSDRKDSSGARCSRERGTFQTIKFSRRADR